MPRAKKKKEKKMISMIFTYTVDASYRKQLIQSYLTRMKQTNKERTHTQHSAIKEGYTQKKCNKYQTYFINITPNSIKLLNSLHKKKKKNQIPIKVPI